MESNLQKGVRYGIIIWLFLALPMDHSLWVLFPIPYSLTLQWALYDLLEILVAGILVAVIYKPVAPAKA